MFERLVAPSTLRPFAARANVLFPGIYAWATTVAVPATSALATPISRTSALLALVSLVLGPLWAPTRPTLGRVFGIHGFVGLSVVSWALFVGAGISLGSEPLQATLGALGWMAYAFGWGELRPRGAVPEDDPRFVPGPPLLPRSVLGKSIEPVLLLGIVGMLALVYAAFRVARPAHAVLAQGVGVVASLLVIGAATRVALDRAPRTLPSGAERMSFASTPLAALLIILGLGLLFSLLAR